MPLIDSALDPNLWAQAIATIIVALGGFVLILRGQSRAKTDVAEIHAQTNSHQRHLTMLLAASVATALAVAAFAFFEAGANRPANRGEK